MNIIETKWNWRNGSPSRRAATDYIALHHAAAKTCTAAQVDDWHKSNGWSGIGYHFFVRKDGSIYRGRPLDSIGAHVQGMNNRSIGICAEGNYDIEKDMPAAQKNAIKALLRYLKGIYPAAKIVGHREIGESDCPGKYYPIFEMKNHYNDDEEEIDMEQLNELKKQVAELTAKVSALNPMIYDYIDSNMPGWARPTIQKLVGNGILKGDDKSRLRLTDDMLRLLVVMDRCGLFG
jgi:N-acetyl-anhydromuramyl-L-alanine amidase AmpD